VRYLHSLTLNMMVVQAFETSETTGPATQHHITEGFNLYQIPRILWEKKVHYHFHNSQLVTILC
jgi:hypothetical protein